MNIHEATVRYEAWLAAQIKLIPEDIEHKHQRMAEAAFPFLRATYYRWAQRFREVCAELMNAPQVLGVGDLHVENFGTWRDTEGRLIWGINDFDEASPQPYANDLVRLATVRMLAIESSELEIEPADACDAILCGYSDTIGGKPEGFVLEEQHATLREMAHSQERDPVSFWDKLGKLKTIPEPDFARPLLQKWLPEPGLPYRVVHRQAGLGSLGRQHYTALATWGGSNVAREAKELALSAWTWDDSAPKQPPSQPAKENDKILYPDILRQAIRVHDPFFQSSGPWIVRRLGPYCSRIELSHLAAKHDSKKLLHAMGSETGNVHAGDIAAASVIHQDLPSRGHKWLLNSARAMADDVKTDWTDWKRGSATK